ncbi:MAG: Fic family protein [Nitrospirota bacterium]
MIGILTEIDKLQKEINNYRPLGKELLKQIRQYYRIGLTYTSNAIEGNSLTESETKVVLEDGITIGGKPLKDHYEAIGHSEAFDFLYSLVKNKSVGEKDIKKLHRFFYYRIDEKKAGQYRKTKVFITGSKYPLPASEEIPELMKALPLKIKELKETSHPVEASALAHKEFVFIHPFVDGNGRVARLLMNLILLQAGYNIAIIPPIMRQDYIQTLEKAHTNDKEFIDLIARMVRETQKDFLRLFK